MAPNPKDNNEVNHECIYVGEHDGRGLQPTEKRPAPPSIELARTVALGVLSGDRGCYRSSDHFSIRMTKRNFDVFDIEYAVRNGSCPEGGEYNEFHKNHKYVFCCDIDGVGFEAVFALSAEHDLIKSPLMVLITGIWKTESGERSERY